MTSMFQVTEGYFLTVNSDNSGSAVQKQTGETQQTQNSALVYSSVATPLHWRAALLGLRPTAHPQGPPIPPKGVLSSPQPGGIKGL